MLHFPCGKKDTKAIAINLILSEDEKEVKITCIFSVIRCPLKFGFNPSQLFA